MLLQVVQFFVGFCCCLALGFSTSHHPNKFVPAFLTMKPSFFDQVSLAPEDPILSISTAYKADLSPLKVDLGVGAYRDKEGNPVVFQAVREAELQLAKENLNKEYIPIDGLPELKLPTQQLLFGPDSEAIKEDRIATMQSISGTGALKLVAEWLAGYLGGQNTKLVAYASKPTWGNHASIFSSSGFELRDYPYWDKNSHGIDFKALKSTLENAEKNSVVILHGCAHNPTGIDPSESQWVEIVAIVKDRSLIPIVDYAYQGFATGDLIKDGYVARLFDQAGIPAFFTQSFAKNFGLYGERIGCLHVITSTPDEAKHVLSRMKQQIRASYSSPPVNGARIVLRVLTDPQLRKLWEEELKTVSHRIAQMRSALRADLENRDTPGVWNHITQQTGMFSFTGLTVEQCEMLTNRWHIYLLKNGRISLAGINDKNLNYVAKAINDVVVQSTHQNKSYSHGRM